MYEYVCMNVCMHVCMYVCIYVCMHACMRAYVHACMHACIYIYVYQFIICGVEGVVCSTLGRSSRPRFLEGFIFRFKPPSYMVWALDHFYICQEHRSLRRLNNYPGHYPLGQRNDAKTGPSYPLAGPNPSRSLVASQWHPSGFWRTLYGTHSAQLQPKRQVAVAVADWALQASPNPRDWHSRTPHWTNARPGYIVHISMNTYNACHWLIVGRSEHCGKPCINDLCGIHRAQLCRRPGTEPHSCRWCGRGTKSETQLCSRVCRSAHVKKALHRAEAKARRLHPALMHELLLAAHRQRILPFVGLR